MLDVLPYAIVASLLLLMWVAGLFALDVFTPGDLRAWRRLAALRGYATPQSRLQRTLMRVPAAQRLQKELDLQRQLAIAGRSETPLAFIGKASALSLMALGVLFAVDVAGRAVAGDWPMAPWAVVLISLSVLPLCFAQLARSVRRTRDSLARILGDMTMIVAVMTDSRGFQLDDAVRALSRCAHDPALQHLIDQEGFRALVGGPYRTTIEQYRMVGGEYGVPALTRLADAAETANVGIAERDVYTRLALATYRERLAQARLTASRAKILVTLPVAAMLIPLLLLIGAPAFSAISSGVQGG